MKYTTNVIQKTTQNKNKLVVTHPKKIVDGWRVYDAQETMPGKDWNDDKWMINFHLLELMSIWVPRHSQRRPLWKGQQILQCGSFATWFCKTDNCRWPPLNVKPSNEIRIWIGNYIYIKLYDAIIHPCPKLNEALGQPPLMLGHGWVTVAHRNHDYDCLSSPELG